MMLEKKEAVTYTGGGSISAAFISACTNLFKALYGFGQDLGATIIRAIRGTSC